MAKIDYYRTKSKRGGINLGMNSYLVARQIGLDSDKIW